MEELFSEKGSRLLAEFVGPKTLLAFDFDGTLAPIVKNRDIATIGKKEKLLLNSLSSLAQVVVISGRSLSDLRLKLSEATCLLVGNHGLEGAGLNLDEFNQFHSVCEFWKSQLAKERLCDGISIEDKSYSLSIHYRNTANQNVALSELNKIVRTLSPTPRVISGACVLNLLPTNAYNKGSALVDLMRRNGSIRAVFVGDDDTDEDVFRLPSESVLGIRVGFRSDSAARCYVKSRKLVIDILMQIQKLLLGVLCPHNQEE